MAGVSTGVSDQGVRTVSTPPAPVDTLPPVTTVSLRAAQLIARHKPFVADFNVPKAEVTLAKQAATKRPLSAIDKVQVILVHCGSIPAFLTNAA